VAESEIPLEEGEDEELPEGEKSQARAALFEMLANGNAEHHEQSYASLIDAVGDTLKKRLAAAGMTDKGSVGAVNQYRGMWFEDLVVLDWYRTALALLGQRPDALIALPMPKRTELELESLWVPAIRDLVSKLEQDLKAHDTVMRASNPDLILIRASSLERHCAATWHRVKAAADDHERVLAMSNVARALVSRLEYDELAGVMSLKTSLRVDRKVQPLQEANRIKALRKYIRTRIWRRNDSPFGFFVTLMEPPKGKPHPSSPEIFYTNVLLYSIVAIDERPSAAVDGVLRITSTSGLRAAVDQVHAKLST
jgi:hypothetical protein